MDFHNCKYFDDLEIGESFISEKRTVTFNDIMIYSGLSGDFNPLHINEEFAAKTIHGGIIAHGALVYSITTGLFNSIGKFDGTIIAFLGLSFEFRAPVKPGDTLHVISTITDKRLSRSKPDRGIVFFDTNTYNQRGELTLEGKWKILFRRGDQYLK